MSPDNFFTSIPTAEFLLHKNITMTGKLRTKKLDIPAVVEDAKEEMFYRRNSSFLMDWQ